MFKQYHIKDYRFRLVLYVSLLTIVGILVIGSAEESVQNKQILGFVLGLIVMVVVSLMDYSVVLKLAWGFYVLSIVLLLWVEFFGENIKGSQRWIKITDSFGFQPSEIVKIFLILFFAYYFMKKQEKINTLSVLFTSFLFTMVPCYLIVKQPDLSTTIVVFLIFLVMLYIAGLSYKIIFTALAVLIPATIVGMSYILSMGAKATNIADVDYHLIRIYAWRFPDNPLWSSRALQQQNSMMAIGSGQFSGKGLDNSDATSLLNGNFIAEAQTDFIFSVVGEELGFIGSIIIVVLLALIVIECILVARKARDLSGRLICCGMATLVGMQSFINIAVATGLIPNTGIPLPFVSYGLTSLVSIYIGIGFVLNVGLQPKRYKGDLL